MNREAAVPRPFAVPQLSDAETLRVVARHDAAVERRRYDAGFSQGHADGYASGVAAVEGAIADHRRNAERLDALCSALEGAIAEVRQNEIDGLAVIERAVAEMSLAIAETVLGREIDDRNVVVDSILRCLQLSPSDETIVVHVHPDDADCAVEAREAGLVGPVDGFTVVADASVERGGCVVDAGPAQLDGQLGGALARVRDAVLGG